MLRKNFKFFKVSLFSTNISVDNCAESRRKTTKLAP